MAMNTASGDLGGTVSRAMHPEVWVWLTRERSGSLHPALAGALHEGGALARRLDCALVAIGDREPDAQEREWLHRWGVTQARVLGAALPPHPALQPSRFPLGPLLTGARPRVLLLLAEAFGRAVAPLLAEALGAVCLTGMTGITWDGARLVASRPTLGGQFESLARPGSERPVVVTLNLSAAGSPPEPPRGSPGREVIVVHGGEQAPGPEHGEPRLHPPDPARLELAEAERIVAFGRGAFNEAALTLVRRLAAVLGAVIAGTRPAADEGWIPFSHQVGLTGAVVRPRLYVAVGLSGAPYHLVGVKDPETLIAINADPEAPVFASAHLGLVGDLHTVLPALLERLEQGRAPRLSDGREWPAGMGTPREERR